MTWICDSRMNVPVLCQLNHLTLCWQSPFKLHSKESHQNVQTLSFLSFFNPIVRILILLIILKIMYFQTHLQLEKSFTWQQPYDSHNAQYWSETLYCSLVSYVTLSHIPPMDGTLWMCRSQEPDNIKKEKVPVKLLPKPKWSKISLELDRCYTQ